MNVRNQTEARFAVYRGNFVASYLSYRTRKKDIGKKKKNLQKALDTFGRQSNINIVTITVKPGQGHHKYHVTFTVHIPLDSHGKS